MFEEKPVIGVGACLVGRPVRYNGDSKRHNRHIEALGGCAELRSFCPEVGIGLGVPRETIRLVGDSAEAVSLRDSSTQQKDYTEVVKEYAAYVIGANPDMSGYILVKGSPSCGLDRVKRYNADGNAVASDATGVFAAELMRLDPLMPVEEDGRLNDNALRENFVTRVFAYQDWKQSMAAGITKHKLLTFWSRYKFLAMAHNVCAYRNIGYLVANASNDNLQQCAEEFISQLMSALEYIATRKTRTNVLHHIGGYLKRDISCDDKQELSDVIEQYRMGVVPLVVPITLLCHYFRLNDKPYINHQIFFFPYPEQLGLRNYV